jgi:phage gp36-like protein
MPAQCGPPTLYITQQGLEDRFGREFLLRVTDPTGTGEVDQGKVNRAIGDATELVNSYLGKRYTLPVPFVPGALERVAADLVRYLYSSQPGEEVTKRYDDGVKWLKDVANGVVSLGLPVPETPPAPPARWLCPARAASSPAAA